MATKLPQQQVVQWAKIDRLDPVRLDEPDAFEFRKDRGWHWLQRSCFWVLGKIGAYQQKTFEVFRRTPQENNDLLKSLLGQEGQWLRLINERADCRIFMGPDDQMDLMRLCEFREMRPTSFRGRIETRQRRGDYTESCWHDIPITVVPWMKGAILVPDGQ